MSESTSQTASNLSVLRRLKDGHSELDRLKALAVRFNVFDALGCARAEIRHSRFLAWLLDPSESHGCGDSFLRSVLGDLFSRCTDGPTIADFETEPLAGVEVRREWKHIDLLITCDSPSFVVAIENKIDSGEHSDQLRRYREVLSREFQSKSQLLVLLTPGGDRGSDPCWLPYSYKELYQAICRCRESPRNIGTGDVLVFVDHYLRLVRSWFMSDPEVDRLCRQIYREHRQAIDLINHHIRTEPLWLVDAIEAAVRERTDLYSYRLEKEVGFMPKSWLRYLPPALEIGKHEDWKDIDPRAWVSFYTTIDATGANWHFWVGMTRDRKLRRDIVRGLVGAGIGVSKPKMDKDDDLLVERFMTWHPGLEPEADDVRAAMRTALAALDERFHPILSVLKRAGGGRRAGRARS